MPEPYIEDLEYFLQLRQRAVNTAINDLTFLRNQGHKLLSAERTSLLASIITAVDTVPEMSDRQLFAGNPRPDA